jgi:hypothetical protein
VAQTDCRDPVRLHRHQDFVTRAGPFSIYRCDDRVPAAVRLGCGLVAHTNVVCTMLETVLIAAEAAGAGLLIGQLITHWAVGGA